MRTHLPERASAFQDLFAQVEHVLRRNGYSRANRARAEIDWERFSEDLGDTFFAYVLEARVAETLIGEPPRYYHRNGSWQPKKPASDKKCS